MSDSVVNDEKPAKSETAKKWVQFEETNVEVPDNNPEPSPSTHYNGAVIDTESVQVDIDKVKQLAQSPGTAAPKKPAIPRNLSAPNMRNINLNEGDRQTDIDPSIQRGFANGDIIVTVLPVNQKWPWVTPAEFRPELVPEELMAEGLTLTVEDYVQVMETLVHDVRFTAYNLCYKRLLMAWLLASFIVLLGLLFSGAKGITLFGCGVIWLIINAGAIFVCMWMKNKMNHGLEKAVARANQTLVRHRIILGVDDRGKLSCHKTNLCFIYFDTADCIRKLQSVLDAEEAAVANRTETNNNPEEARRQRDVRLRMDIDDSDIVVAGANPTRISRKQERADMLLLRYSQRWVKALVRQSLELQLLVAQAAAAEIHNTGGGQSHVPPTPRHCATSQCPCQYIQDHLYDKKRGVSKTPCWQLPSFGFK